MLINRTGGLFSMGIKLTMILMLFGGMKFFYDRFSTMHPDTTITEEWWDGLSEEWKSILIVNQSFQKQKADIFKIQKEYVNRLNKNGETNLSEINTSLHELVEGNRFALGYRDFYERAIRTDHIVRGDSIDLKTLETLETIYMVNGPGDLSPLIKFPHLKVLVINFCGIDPNAPGEEHLDLSPLKYLKELKILHCSSIALKSLSPIKDLKNLEELFCENSGVTTVGPLENLISLKKLSFGSGILKAPQVSRLINLEELHISGCKEMPDLSKLRNLKKLSIAEHEMAIVNSSFRINKINFLTPLTSLEFLDMQFTSYKGTLEPLLQLSNLKAVAFSPVSPSEVEAFKEKRKGCVILNDFQFER
jgi:Leucine-rich repeat (LRR) protein